MIHPLVLTIALMAGPGGYDACFDYAQVVQQSQVLKESRRRIDASLRDRHQAVEGLQSERRDLQMARDLLDASRPSDRAMARELDLRIEALERRITEDLTRFQDQLDRMLTVETDSVARLMAVSLDDFRAAFRIDQLHPECRPHPQLPDLTEAVLSHLREAERQASPAALAPRSRPDTSP